MKHALLLIVTTLFFSVAVAAQTAAQTVAPLDIPAKQAFLLDANTNTVLYAKAADERMPTSSMSKMMVMYMVFDAIKTGKLKLDDTLPVSEHAWKQEGSRMFVNVGDKVKVEDLIRGVIVQSGNDAAVVFAEGLGSGSESNFAEMMNAKALALGMTNSHFMNAPGLPDPDHYSTAHDLSILALALMRDFPEDYHYFSEKEFTYNGIKQGNRNPLLYRNMDVDGLKTGHTDVGGFGLTGSAIRGGHRLVFVLNGLKNMQERADVSATLLDWGYREFGLYPALKKDDRLGEVKVYLGKALSVPAVVEKDVVLTLPKSMGSTLKTEPSLMQQVDAPVKKGQVLGKITITAQGMEPREVALLAADDVERLGFFDRMVVKIKEIIAKAR